MFRNSIRMAHSSSRPCPDYIGESGLKYQFQQIVQRRPETGSVWIAQAQNRKYILKERPHPNIRLPRDSVPGQRILVYDYLSHKFLELARNELAFRDKKSILKQTLQGLAELHNSDIVHLDVKPDNIVVETSTNTDRMPTIDAVQVTDIENAVWLKPGLNVSGALVGNDNWRSPEAHLRAKLHKPADMYSFEVVCIYAMLGRIVFGRDADFEYHESLDIDPPVIRLQRQVSVFGDEAGYQGLRRHLSDDPRHCLLLDVMWEDRGAPHTPYTHFSTWPGVEDDAFRDLVLKLMNLDPSSRITASEALQHPWFAEAEASLEFHGLGAIVPTLHTDARSDFTADGG
ncbi:kinase domain-containing protein [Teratosphaeria nubilosa]|uniref:Kinase domain-containing protein n=1 Tax=Teratosphaeria nubilosa TaxID=161662 RepID=A0A6G1KXU0_9PEZI|nr:kinase domain-containing protein [Teratosphaeria nubilosa]